LPDETTALIVEASSNANTFTLARRLRMEMESRSRQPSTALVREKSDGTVHVTVCVGFDAAVSVRAPSKTNSALVSAATQRRSSRRPDRGRLR
jgi:hypothetical protein